MRTRIFPSCEGVVSKEISRPLNPSASESSSTNSSFFRLDGFTAFEVVIRPWLSISRSMTEPDDESQSKSPETSEFMSKEAEEAACMTLELDSGSETVVGTA